MSAFPPFTLSLGEVGWGEPSSIKHTPVELVGGATPPSCERYRANVSTRDMFRKTSFASRHLRCSPSSSERYPLPLGVRCCAVVPPSLLPLSAVLDATELRNTLIVALNKVVGIEVKDLQLMTNEELDVMAGENAEQVFGDKLVDVVFNLVALQDDGGEAVAAA